MVERLSLPSQTLTTLEADRGPTLVDVENSASDDYLGGAGFGSFTASMLRSANDGVRYILDISAEVRGLWSSVQKLEWKSKVYKIATQ